MSKRHKRGRLVTPTPPAKSSRRATRGLWIFAALALFIVAGLAVVMSRGKGTAPSSIVPKVPSNSLISFDAVLPTNEVAHSLVVTVELDFGGRSPRFADAVKEIERRYEPADGVGRTFAILDAYGETNARSE